MTTIRSIFEIVASGVILWVTVAGTSYVTGLSVGGASVLVAASMIVWVIWKEKK